MDEWLEMIEKERIARGLNHRQVAELSRVSQSAVSCWFSGKRKPTKLSKILVEEALGLRPKPKIDPDIILLSALRSHPGLSEFDVDDIMALVREKLSRA